MANIFLDAYRQDFGKRDEEEEKKSTNIFLDSYRTQFQAPKIEEPVRQERQEPVRDFEIERKPEEPRKSFFEKAREKISKTIRDIRGVTPEMVGQELEKFEPRDLLFSVKDKYTEFTNNQLMKQYESQYNKLQEELAKDNPDQKKVNSLQGSVDEINDALGSPPSAKRYITASKEEFKRDWGSFITGAGSLITGLADFTTKIYEQDAALFKHGAELEGQPKWLAKIYGLQAEKQGYKADFAKDLSDSTEQWTTEVSPTNPDFMDKLASGTGSMAGFLALAATTGLPAEGMAVFEAMQESGNVYKTNRKNGMDVDEASELSDKDFLANLVINYVTNKFGLFSDQAKGIKKSVISASLEGMQEAWQQLASNWTTKNENLMEGVLESLGIGSILGGSFSVVLPSGEIMEVTGTQEGADLKVPEAPASPAEEAKDPTEESVENVRQYIQTPAVELTDSTITNLKESQVGVEELTFDEDGNIVLYREGAVTEGVPNSYSLEQKGNQEAYILNKDEILINTTSGQLLDLYASYYEGQQRDANLDALEKFNKLEAEIIAIPEQIRAAQELEVSEVRYESAEDFIQKMSEEEIRKRAAEYDTVEDFIASFEQDLGKIQEIEEVQQQLEQEELAPEEKRMRERISMQNFRQIAERFFPKVRDYYADDNIRTVDDYLQNVDAYAIGLELDSDRIANEQIRDLLGNDDVAWEVIIEDIVDAYKAGTLPETIEETRFEVEEKALEEVEEDRPREFFETAEAISEENLQETYEKASRKATGETKEETMLSRKQMYIAWSLDPTLHEKLGLSAAELNKKIRSWTGAKVTGRSAQKRANEGVPAQYQWTGITNSNFISKIDLTEADVDAVVNNIKDNTDRFGEFEGSILRRYIMNTFGAIDTRLQYSDLNFEINSLDKALGEFVSKDTNIIIDRTSQNTVAHEIGHYIDNKFLREIGIGFGGLSSATPSLEVLQEKYNLSDDHISWVKEFQGFTKDIAKKGDIGTGQQRAEYLQRRSEVFARFTAEFVDWVSQKSGYSHPEMNYYADRFSSQDFYNFIKLMQKKAEIDLKYNIQPLVDGEGGAVQQKAPTQSEIARQRLADIFAEEKKPRVEAKPTKPKAPKPTVLKSVGKRGAEKGVSKLGLGVEAKAIEKNLTEGFQEIPEYTKIDVKNQIERATKLLEEDYDTAVKIALGQQEPQYGLKPEAVFTVVENNALENESVDLLRQLAMSPRTTEATVMGQRIRLLAERNPDSAVSRIQEVVKDRKDFIEKKLNVKQESEVKKLKKSVDKEVSKIGKSEWASFIDEIQC